MSKILGELSGRKGLSDNLFEAPGIAAAETGTPGKERMEELAGKLISFCSSSVSPGLRSVIFIDIKEIKIQWRRA